MIAVIGGSGFYQLLKGAKKQKVETPYGAPSESIAVGRIGGVKVAFLPRHGREHQYPPHRINYRANLFALKSLGVERIISVTAVGSLQKEIKRGDFVVLDQFVDRTRRRRDTFFDGPVTTHISAAYPFCRQLSKLAFAIGQKQKLRIHPRGTVVVIEGPRFSTKLESLWFSQMGWEVINMTTYPEVVLARELELCYCAIGIVTDYDVGVAASEDLPPVTASEIVEEFSKNINRAKKLVQEIIKKMPKKRRCECWRALEGARF